jgi:hypothetical protein
VDQATQPTTLTAPAEAREPAPQGATITQAHTLVGRIIAQLTTLPRDIEIKRELSGEYSVNVFWSQDVSGVSALASWAGASWELTPNALGSGVYAEARLCVDGVDILAWTLLSPAEAADAEQLLAASRTTPPTEAASETEPAPVSVPLGESPAAQDETALYDESLNRYVASLGGSVVAQIPAVEAGTDEPDTISFAPAVEPGHMVVLAPTDPHTGGDR